MRALGRPNKKSGPGFPAALPLFQPIRLLGYSTKERMSSLLQKTQGGLFVDARGVKNLIPPGLIQRSSI
jgi:hypothetical protein